jgi:hypothetical protein
MAAGHALPELYPLRSFFHAFLACVGRSWRRKAFFGEVLEMFAGSIHKSANSWVIIEFKRILLRIQPARLGRVSAGKIAFEMLPPELCHR